MDKVLIVYTMEGCPYCDMIKNQLKENSIDFYDRDIFKYEKEFDMFVEVRVLWFSDFCEMFVFLIMILVYS